MAPYERGGFVSAQVIVVPVFLMGLLLIFVVLFQIAIISYSALLGLRQAMAVRRHAQLVWRERCVQANASLEWKRASAPAWSGYRKFEVVRKEVEVAGICSFYLTPHDKKPLPPFLAGQFLTFQLGIPGEAEKVIRCYSISSGYSPRHYRVTVKRIPASGGVRGLASNFFHDAIEENTILDVKAPSGKFVLDPWDRRPAVLIAGGIGVTPFLSMMESVADCFSEREVWLFYGVQNGHDHIMRARLRELTAEHDNLHIVVCYSCPRHNDWRKLSFDEQGHIDVALLRQHLHTNNYEFYVCGPPQMMEALPAELAAWGVPKANIHTEAFGPAAIKAKSALSSTEVERDVQHATATWRVRFTKSGKTISWMSGNAGTLLDSADAAGVHIPRACSAGSCGTCQVAVRSGSLSYDDAPAYDVEDGCCLPCVARPVSDLELDA